MSKEEMDIKVKEIKNNLELIKKCDEVYDEILKAQEIGDRGNE